MHIVQNRFAATFHIILLIVSISAAASILLTDPKLESQLLQFMAACIIGGGSTLKLYRAHTAKSGKKSDEPRSL
ncbi:hypothetical protein [Metabacillus sp. 84]|uniref:hypothetical protein n=1 Tax=unclassified Metabacillus TaxID=2675274 RepID=UPI003CF37BD6